MDVRMRRAATAASSKPRAALRSMKAEVEGVFRHREPLTFDDELAMAEQFDRDRGYAMPLRERSKESHALAEGAPVVRWVPPAELRHA